MGWWKFGGGRGKTSRVEECLRAVGSLGVDIDPHTHESFRALRASNDDELRAEVDELLSFGEISDRKLKARFGPQALRVRAELWIAILMRRKLNLDRARVEAIVRCWSQVHTPAAIDGVARFIRTSGLDEGLRDALAALESSYLGELRELVYRPPPHDCDGFGSRLCRDLDAMPAGDAKAWRALFRWYDSDPPEYEPSETWLTEHAEGLQPLTQPALREYPWRWVRSIDASSVEASGPRCASGLPAQQDANSRVFAGLLALLENQGVSDHIDTFAHAARAAFTPVRGLGAYRPKLGYRCVDALASEGGAHAADALRRLAAEVPYPRAQYWIRLRLGALA